MGGVMESVSFTGRLKAELTSAIRSKIWFPTIWFPTYNQGGCTAAEIRPTAVRGLATFLTVGYTYVSSCTGSLLLGWSASVPSRRSVFASVASIGRAPHS